MLPRRVVITGMGAISPYGKGSDTLFAGLRGGQSAITRVAGLEKIPGLGPRIAGLVPDVDFSAIPRQQRRSMSRMSAYAFLAAQEALTQGQATVKSFEEGSLGLVMGSTTGSVEAMEEFFQQYLREYSTEQIKAMIFFRVMGHSVAANVAQSLGISGRVIAPAAACSTGCQSVGLGYESIAFGKQGAVLCGGADEFHPLTSATFDKMTAASCGYNDAPQQSPRPFDTQRDGIVCAEGAGVLLLESLDSALTRGAAILGEVIGFYSSSDASSIANPDPLPIYQCMKNALHSANISPSDVAYVNAHATGTVHGDAAECSAISKLFGNTVPVSSLKGHMGHTMAASGALELIACVHMLQNGIVIPTLNLDKPSPDCSGVQLLQNITEMPIPILAKNNFALGGINCCIILRGYND